MFDRNLMKIEGMGGIMGALVLLALLQAGCVIGQAYAIAHALSALWAGDAIESQAPLVIAFLTCFAVRHLIAFVQDTMLDTYSTKRAAALRKKLLEGVFDADSRTAERVGAASVATIATEGIGNVQEYLRIVPPKVIGIMAISLPVLVAAFVADVPSGIILAVMFPVTIMFMVLLGRRARDRAEARWETYNRLSNHFLDTLRGVDAIVASGAVERVEEEVYGSSEQLRKETVKTLATATLSSAVLDLCATFGVAAVAILLAFRLMDGSMPLSTGLFALVLAPEYFAPIRSFASDFHASLDGKNALAAVLDVANAVEGDGFDGAAEKPEQKAASEGHESGDARISFEHVSYRYPHASLAAVNEVDLTVEQGEHVALVGPSGSGKSTLAALAAGLIEPTAGTVRIDSPVQFIPQDPYIFSASLAENVRLYNPDADESEIKQVLSSVGLDVFVESLPYGVETQIGEGGVGVSGGEAHRIAVARALLDRSGSVLVFDEPTAHLDIETELELKRSVLPLLEGRTVLFATHRLHWLADMDRVVRLNEGEVLDVA